MPPKRNAAKATAKHSSRARPSDDRASVRSHSHATTTSIDQDESQEAGDTSSPLEHRLKRAEARATKAEEVRALLEREVTDLKMAAVQKDNLVMGIQKTQRDIDNERAEWKDKEREFMDKINSITRDFESERAQWKDKQLELELQIREHERLIQAGIVAERDSDRQVQAHEKKIDCLERELRESHDRQRRAVEDCKTAEANAARCEAEVDNMRRALESSRREYVHLKTNAKQGVADLEARLAGMEKHLKGLKETNDFLVNTTAGELAHRLHNAQMKIIQLQRMTHPLPPSTSSSDHEQPDQWRGLASPKYGNEGGGASPNYGNEGGGSSPNYGGNEDSFEADPRDMVPRMDSGRHASRMREHPDLPPPVRNHWSPDDRWMADRGRDGGYRHHSMDMDNRGGLMDGGWEGDTGRFTHRSMKNRGGLMNDGWDGERFRKQQHWHEDGMGRGRGGEWNDNPERYRHHSMLHGGGMMDMEDDAARYRQQHPMGDMGERFDDRERDDNSERFRRHSKDNMGGRFDYGRRDDIEERFRHPMDNMGGGMMHDESAGTCQPRFRHSMDNTMMAHDGREGTQPAFRHHSVIELDGEEEEPTEKRRRGTMGGGGGEERRADRPHLVDSSSSTVAIEGGQRVYSVASEEPPTDGVVVDTGRREVKEEESPEEEQAELDMSHPAFRALVEAHKRMVTRIRPKDE